MKSFEDHLLDFLRTVRPEIEYTFESVEGKFGPYRALYRQGTKTETGYYPHLFTDYFNNYPNADYKLMCKNWIWMVTHNEGIR